MLRATQRPSGPGVDKKNTWTDQTGARMSQGQIVTADILFCGQIVWVEISPGKFASGRIVKAPEIQL
jgi:hypothetical protein